MSQQRVRIVVGEGRSSRQGLLRYVLDGEGYDVVADAVNPAELARVLAVHKPDVVVLDDGIGATAVGMVHEMVPGAKVVLVWPGAVVPIGGAAQVEPSQVLQDLGPAIARLTGAAGATVAGEGAAVVERAKKDPSALRRMLRSVDRSRSRKDLPSEDDLGAAGAGEAIIEDREPAPVVILPLTAAVGADELVLHVPEAVDGSAAPPGTEPKADVTSSEEAEEEDDRSRAAVVALGTAAGVAATVATAGSAAAAEAGPGSEALAAAGAETGDASLATVGAQSALNRRLGNMALAGAAAAAALVLALALGGAKVPIAGVSGQAPVASQPGGQGPGGSGQPNGTDSGPGGGDNPAAFYPIQPYLSSLTPFTGFVPGTGGPPGTGPPPGTGNDGGGNGNTGNDNTGNDGGHNGGGDDLGGIHGSDGGGHGGGAPAKHPDTTPGHSGEHNPHGGPPGQTGSGGDHSNAGGGKDHHDHSGDHPSGGHGHGGGGGGHGHSGEHRGGGHGHGGEHGGGGGSRKKHGGADNS
jgi:hypothetical protein